jgi:hypothetical protein
MGIPAIHRGIRWRLRDTLDGFWLSAYYYGVPRATNLRHRLEVNTMKRADIHTTLPPTLHAMVITESDRSGDTLAAVVRRCIRGQLSSLAGTKEYQTNLDALKAQYPEEE